MAITITNADHVYRVNCPHCPAQLQYELSDIKTEGATGRRGTSKITSIECPVCHNSVRVTSHTNETVEEQ